MTPAIAERELFLVCSCGSRVLIGVRDGDVWIPRFLDERQASPWFAAHSPCWNAIAAQHAEVAQ